VLAASPEHQSKVCGAEREVGEFLELIRETVLEALRQQLHTGPLLPDMSALLEYVQVDLAHRKSEELRVFFVDARLRLVRDEIGAKGSVDRLTIYPREILRRALELGATGLILVHNHPSGHTIPSADDVRITRELGEAAGPLGVELHDHLVVGPAGWTSLRREGLL
jgi:DNA repair protein RadC